MLVKEAIAKRALANRVAIITGASRGIGREIALTFARAGAKVVVAAKSTQPQPTLPGTIFTVAEEVEKLGSEALPLKVDVREEKDLEGMVSQTIDKFGRVDYLINNAGALWWKNMIDTPTKRYDLITQVNARATFIASKLCLPHMLSQKHGHIVNMSPPIDLEMLQGKVGYCISKFGMTMVAHGLAEECRGKGVAANALWPRTAVESFATKNFQLGDETMWRKASILADATLMICTEDPNQFSGHAMLDEDYLRLRGFQDEDFVQYRCDPNHEPLSIVAESTKSRWVDQTVKAAGWVDVGHVNDAQQQALRSTENIAVSGILPQVEQLFNGLGSTLPNEAVVKQNNAAFHFLVKAKANPSQEVHYFLDLKNGGGSLVKGSDAQANAANADVSMTCEDETFLGVFKGKVNPASALASGAVKVKGNPMKLMGLMKLGQSKM